MNMTKVLSPLLYWAVIAVLLPSFNVTAKEAFQLVGETTAPGEKHSYMATEGEVTLPVTVINGKKPGKVLLLTAGIHGDEFPSMLALQKLREEVDPSTLNGTLIIVHLANLDGFHGRRIALNPKDEKNLNRVFPGNKNGSATEQIAELLTREFISRADFLIDMHSGSADQQLIPHVYSPFVGNKNLDELTLQFAKATGMKHIILYGDRPHDPANSVSYPNTAMTRGKPGLTTEIGYNARSDDQFVENVLSVARSALRFLHMVPGKPESHEAPVIYDRLVEIKSHNNGFFDPKASIGDSVGAGDVLGVISDYFGNPVEKVLAPEAGIVLMIAEIPPVKADEVPVTLAIESSY